MRRHIVGCSAALLFAACLHAQTFTTGPCPDGGEKGHKSWFGGSSGDRACELRRTTLPLRDGHLEVTGTNGGIEVVGADRPDVALEARVTAQGSSHDDAVALLHRVQIETGGASIRETGPKTSGWFGHGWSVSYRLQVPRHLAARFRTENGAIDLTDIEGPINAETTNGGLELRNLGGEVHAATVNGAVAVVLAGKQWHGSGLSANSTNGAVSIKAPGGYSAHLIADTTNGGIAVAFPVTVQGSLRNHIDTNLGNGGATLQFRTVNGGVAVARE